MIREKSKEVGRKILERVFNMFEGMGIGKIPGFFKLFLYFEALLFDTIVKIDGQKIHLDVSFGPRSTLNLYFKRIHEPRVTSIFCSLIKEGDIVVDAGASIGYYTLLAAKRVGKNGYVYAFEPYPPSFKRLMENIKLNNWKNVHAYQLALSDSTKEEKFYVSKSGVVSGSSFALRRDSICITVKAKPLDDIIKANIDLVKIDVEGAELEVLKGMEKTLAKGKAKIICEVHPKDISLLGYDISEITNLLRKHGYKIYLIDEERGLIPMNNLSASLARYLFTREEI